MNVCDDSMMRVRGGNHRGWEKNKSAKWISLFFHPILKKVECFNANASRESEMRVSPADGGAEEVRGASGHLGRFPSAIPGKFQRRNAGNIVLHDHRAAAVVGEASGARDRIFNVSFIITIAFRIIRIHGFISLVS
jgi:hypothetical protein